MGVARNLVEGRGLVSDALWSYATPPLVFPRPAFEVWLPLPTFLSAIPMALRCSAPIPFETAMRAAQVVSVLARAPCSRSSPGGSPRTSREERGLPRGRARTLAIGTGLDDARSTCR